MRAFTVGNPDVYEGMIDGPEGCNKAPGGAVFVTAGDAARALNLPNDLVPPHLYNLVTGLLPTEWFPGLERLPGRVYALELTNGLGEDTEPCDYGYGARRLKVKAAVSRLEKAEVTK